MFGRLRVTDATGQQVVDRFRSQNFAALLAYLALFRRRTHTREELTDLFWPDSEPNAARANLRQALTSLRRQLEPPGVPAGAVIGGEGRLSVALGPCVVTDVGEFEAALEAARRAPDGAARAAHLERAVGVYAGPLLPGHYEDWALAERERLEDAHRDALRQLVAHYERSGDAARALAFARQAVSAAPGSDEARADVNRLLAARVRPETAAVREKLQPVPARAAVLAPPAPVAFRTARNEERPPVSDFPARPTVSLPPVFNRFFGREDDLAALGALWAGREARLVTLTGPGGSGKTRLAVEAARANADAFPGGVFFVPLADIPADVPAVGEAVAEAVARALGVSLEGAPAAARERVVEALAARCASTPLLLILDNFEHLAEEGAALVSEMLARSPLLFCLVTSRQTLLVDAERALPVAPLPVPPEEGGDTSQSAREAPSVQLFADRARSIRPDFLLNPSNTPVIAALCARLEGVPLAIELAAGWAGALTPGQMLERLGGSTGTAAAGAAPRLDLLVSRRRDLAPRHRTLRAAVEWSWGLLPEGHRRLFTRLSVFRGGWTLEAAGAVCGGDAGTADPAAVLAELRDHSLIVGEEVAHAGGTEIRFRMLETLREFADERTEADERESLARLHARHFLSVAEGAGPEQYPRLERDIENLRAALEWCFRAAGLDGVAAAGSDPAGGCEAAGWYLRLAAALGRFWVDQGHLSDARRWLRPGLLEAATARGVTPLTAARAYHAALHAADIGVEPEQTRIAAGEGALHWYEAAGEGRCAAAGGALALLGYFHTGRSRAERLAMARRGRRLCRDAGDPRAEADATLALASIVREELACIGGACRMLARAVRQLRAAGEERRLMRVLRELGAWHWWNGDLALSEAEVLEALALARRFGSHYETAYGLWTLGGLWLYQERYDEAEAVQREALALARRSGDVFCQVMCLGNLALGVLARGDEDRALALFNETVGVTLRWVSAHRRRFVPWEYATSLEGAAMVYARRGDVRRAARLFGYVSLRGRSAWEEPRPRPGYSPALAARYHETRAAIAALPGGKEAWERGQAMTPEEAERCALGR